MSSGYRAIKRAASAAAIYEAEVRGTKDGVRLGRIAAEREARTAAFGAIRRAAEIARKYDADSIADRLATHGLSADIASSVANDRARVTRAAIRAAIGSDKA